MNKILSPYSQKKYFAFYHTVTNTGGLSGECISGDFQRGYYRRCSEVSGVTPLVSAEVRYHHISKLPAKVKPLQQETYKIC